MSMHVAADLNLGPLNVTAAARTHPQCESGAKKAANLHHRPASSSQGHAQAHPSKISKLQQQLQQQADDNACQGVESTVLASPESLVLGSPVSCSFCSEIS